MPALFTPPASSLDAGVRLGVAALVGLAVGIEREWSGHAPGASGRFAGLRTFFLFGVAGGVAGLLTATDLAALGAAIVVGTALLVAGAFVVAMRRPGEPLDATTEAAALVVLALGAVAGLGQLAIAAGGVAVVVFMLGEKQKLHWLVQRIGEDELHAAAQFAVLALVVLPVLPTDAFPWLGGMSPRDVWALVLLFSGINFAGYIARHAVGADRGYTLTGFLGGLISSTLVTLQFARRSREEPEHGAALALGVVAACTVLPVRVSLVTLLLSPPVAGQAAPLLAAPLAAGVVLIGLGLRRASLSGEDGVIRGSPLGLVSAIRMTGLFVLALAGITWVRGLWGAGGVIASAVLLGLTDMDALTVAMTRLGAENPGTMLHLAAVGIAVGVLSNTMVKLGIAVVVGQGRFRREAAIGLGVMAAVVGVALAV